MFPPDFRFAISAPPLDRSGVIAAPLGFYARSPHQLVISPRYDTAETAHRIADAMDYVFSHCPAHQQFCAAQAAMGIK